MDARAARRCRSTPRRGVAALLVVLIGMVAAAGGCAGYRFGNNTLYAPNVRTVYVPMIQSDSFRTTPSIDVGERLTEAVCKEIEKRTPFKVVSSPDADSVLTARVVADTKRMVVESPTDQSRMVEMNFQVLVTWADRGGAVLAAGCAGYRFGNNTLYAPTVRTVYVPMIQSDSFRTTPGIDLGERLTEAVCKEIEKRTPFKVVGSEEAADSVLTGRVVSDTKRMVVESPTDQSRQVEMNYQVLVTWADRGGTVIASGDVPLPAATVDVGQAASLVPEFGRSVASTQQEAIVKLAQQIVGLMEEPW